VGIAGGPASDVDRLQDILAAIEPPFELTVLRGTEERTLTVRGPEVGQASP